MKLLSKSDDITYTCMSNITGIHQYVRLYVKTQFIMVVLLDCRSINHNCRVHLLVGS